MHNRLACPGNAVLLARRCCALLAWLLCRARTDVRCPAAAACSNAPDMLPSSAPLPLQHTRCWRHPSCRTQSRWRKLMQRLSGCGNSTGCDASGRPPPGQARLAM